MRVVGIVGYKKSGKTTLGLKLAKELISQGYRVAAIKHISENINKTHTDTDKYKDYLSQVVAINSKESIIFLKNKKSIDSIVNYIEADIVLIEGFKKEKTFPKIICLKEASEKEELFDGLELCTASLFPANERENLSDYSILDDKDVKEMAKIVIKKAFKLPNLNCGACGFSDCFALAKEIVKGNNTIKDCVSLNSELVVTADGKKINMNSFISKMVKNTIYGILSPLKGFKEGNIKIKLKEK
ncbi:MAG: molybdopterin-guanine dinucleotide biosynthesis protein B [Candidatus Caldatribacteriota bacterium]|nr:molybdopterin-guanine dinucleotide biosynthesis protein B [Candidatus Caldatribacteriota bacterium]